MDDLQNIATTTISNENKSGEQVTTKAEQPKVKSSEILRALSEDLKINLFDESGVSALKDKIAQTETERTTFKTQYDEALKIVEDYKKKEADYQVKIEALGMGFQAGQLEEVIALAKVNTKENQTILDGLKIVKEKYGSTFIQPKNVGTQFNDFQGNKPDIPKSDQEKYLAQSPQVIKWQKTQEKMKK